MLFFRGCRRHSYVKESKYALYFKKVEFLGHIVSEDNVSIQTSKIDSVKDWLAPTTIIEL